MSGKVEFNSVVQMVEIYNKASREAWKEGSYCKAAWCASKIPFIKAFGCCRGNIARMGERDCQSKCYTFSVKLLACSFFPCLGPVYCCKKSCCKADHSRRISVQPQSEPNSPGSGQLSSVVELLYCCKKSCCKADHSQSEPNSPGSGQPSSAVELLTPPAQADEEKGVTKRSPEKRRNSEPSAAPQKEEMS